MNSDTTRKDIIIEECYEPLLSIPNDGRVLLTCPHPYEVLWAPYNGVSPFLLRKTVLASLLQVAKILDDRNPGYRLKIFDAYRPLAVQEFMVNYIATEYAKKVYSIPLSEAPDAIRQLSIAHACQLFAYPDSSPLSPPPHSTGAAMDLTIIDEKDQEIPTWGKIDELTTAHPNTYLEAKSRTEEIYHKNRLLLSEVMQAWGFIQLEHEWWHFSQGDQNAIYLEAKRKGETAGTARYGRVDL